MRHGSLLACLPMEVRIERGDNFPIRGPSLAVVDKMRTLSRVIRVWRWNRLPVFGPASQRLKRNRCSRKQQFAQMGTAFYTADAFLHRAPLARAYFPADQAFERR